MFSDISALFLAILGILFILFIIIFKLMVWKEKDVVISVHLDADDREIYNRIVTLKDISEQCTIVVVNYGASKRFIDELKECFSDYDFLKIIDKENMVTELHT